MEPGCRRQFKIFHLLGKINSPEKAFSWRYPVQFCRVREKNPDIVCSEEAMAWEGPGRLLALDQALHCQLPPDPCPLLTSGVCTHEQVGTRCLSATLCKPSFLRNRIYLNFQELGNKTAELFPKNNSLRFLACCLN